MNSLEIAIHNETQLRPGAARMWQLACEIVKSGKQCSIWVGEMSKSRSQEAKYHAMIKDIHRCAFRGNTFEGVKALMVAEFAEEMKQAGTPLTHPGETVYSHKLKEWVTVRPSTRRFRKAEAAAFIEFLYALGTELNVIWGEPALAAYAEYREARAA
ncbi:recombination protein NinB [Marinobacterium litorale]|uniref:recombination protein NinB n=1 Tax=Marinobacterium litorale TaxID=404770 RepID=UPI000482A0A4|nr:recombination protein NinB [Marinobacterium litorale]